MSSRSSSSSSGRSGTRYSCSEGVEVKNRAPPPPPLPPKGIIFSTLDKLYSTQSPQNLRIFRLNIREYKRIFIKFIFMNLVNCKPFLEQNYLHKFYKLNKFS